ncbi:hypothetical protein ACRALDRAFT_2027856 [Sodiomyces alcalophilus JCM 7366]|uniref:uncharacterized protein n=1 Tax=Sodiomyces alcalophilus JCM 7366 TaxID=591952 RepID=UPI0039B68A1D
MPSVDVAMARSLRGGVWGSIVSGISADLQARQITETINDVSTAFSSWDNCMAVSWCKWPVIAVIIVGGLILISVVICIARCMCCGLSCCCKFFSCLKCCGNCCGAFDPPGGKRHKYLDEPYSAPNQGYKPQPPMFTAPVFAPSAAPAAAPPQYAEFDVSKKGDADALPAMPTWEGAGSKKVSLEEEAVELETMNKPQAGQSATNTQQNLPGTAGPASPMSPGDGRSPYGYGPAHGQVPGHPHDGSNGYMAGPGRSPDPYADPYGQNGQGYGQPGYDYGHNDPYGQQPSSAYGPGPTYGAAAPGAAMSQGRGTPHQDGNGGFGAPSGQAYHGHEPSRSPPPNHNAAYDQPYGQDGYGQDAYRQPAYGQDGYGQDGYGAGVARGPTPHRSPPLNSPGSGPNGYAHPTRSTPSPAPQGYRRSPGPQADFGYDNPNDAYGRQDTYGGDAYGQASYPQDGQRQHSADAGRQLAGPTSPGLQNNGGFDFSSGYSRPQPQYEYDDHGQVSQQRPPPSSGSETGYPGHKTYQTPQRGWSGV